MKFILTFLALFNLAGISHAQHNKPGHSAPPSHPPSHPALPSPPTPPAAQPNHPGQHPPATPSQPGHHHGDGISGTGHHAPPHHNPVDRTPHGTKIPKGVKPVAPVYRKTVVVQNYHLKYGHKFKGGYYYRDWKHNHWRAYRWDVRYGCYLYYCPYVTCWYYWCPNYFCYLPVTYCPCNTYVFNYVEQPTCPDNCPVPDGADPNDGIPDPPDPVDNN